MPHPEKFGVANHTLVSAAAIFATAAAAYPRKGRATTSDMQEGMPFLSGGEEIHNRYHPTPSSTLGPVPRVNPLANQHGLQPVVPDLI